MPSAFLTSLLGRRASIENIETMKSFEAPSSDIKTLMSSVRDKSSEP